ncbi:MAG: glycoside hydrolase family 28 protein [Clostridia bacterium]|nr:glycoside hydrolase family 28 protein [Clostridia bacterium]
MKLLYAGAVSAALLVDEQGDYFAREAYTLYVNGRPVKGDTSVISLYGLIPGTEYEIVNGDEKLCFNTRIEYCCLNVRDFGAKGDGIHDDTPAIQAAIGACPDNGRVLIPEGRYNVLPLFLKSNITLEIASGAELLLSTDRAAFPLLPGRVDADDPHGEYLIGGWEGDAHVCHASAINGFGLKHISVIGEGTVNGRGFEAGWWLNPKTGDKPARPRMLYLRDCENVTVQGVHFINSPSWNLHPCFSKNLSFISVRVTAPWNSPNPAGFDPESCRGVKALGMRFSTGDDCIAIKSGKMYMGREYKTPCEDIEIAYCRMLDGHGGVTVGSEMSGGVRRVRVHHCLMEGNDRGLRVKTRRGRGKWGVIDDIVFQDVKMRRVKAPMTVNAMYFCDVDGKTPYVQSREKQPGDEGTPTIGSVVFERVEATDCQACCAYMLGLPENPAHELKLKDCVFTMDEHASPMSPIMSCGVDPCVKRGIYARFVDRVTLENVTMSGVEGEEIIAEDVGEVSRS